FEAWLLHRNRFLIFRGIVFRVLCYSNSGLPRLHVATSPPRRDRAIEGESLSRGVRNTGGDPRSSGMVLISVSAPAELQQISTLHCGAPARRFLRRSLSAARRFQAGVAEGHRQRGAGHTGAKQLSSPVDPEEPTQEGMVSLSCHTGSTESVKFDTAFWRAVVTEIQERGIV